MLSAVIALDHASITHLINDLIAGNLPTGNQAVQIFLKCLDGLINQFFGGDA